jgi:prepilin-type N-terminal cleavage/methylation domain-containing protein
MTLIEILIAMMVLGVIAVILYSVLIKSHETYTSATKLSSLQDRGRVAIDRISNELRQGKVISIATVNGNSALTFDYVTGISSGAPVWSPATTYQWEPEPGGSGRGRLVRIQGSEKLTITDNVAATGLTFTATGNQVKIVLTLEDKDDRGRTLTAPLETSVNLRNK